MRLCVEAWRLREAARAALAAGELGRAVDLAGHAQQLQWTKQGRALMAVSEVLLKSHVPPAIYE